MSTPPDLRLAPLPGAEETSEDTQRHVLAEFLRGLDAAALADKLVDLADRDHDISLELHQWRKSSELSDEPAELEALISETLSPGRDFISWRESASYAWRAEAVLPLLQRARDQDADAAVTLCLHALRRAWEVLSQADDSDGDIGDLCKAIGEQWVFALQAAGPRPVGFGDTYLQVRLDDPFGCFDEDAAEVAIGDVAMTRYRRVLADRWRAAKNAVMAGRAQHAAQLANRKGRATTFGMSMERESRLLTLERLHLEQLEKTGETDEALAVLREDLADAHSCSHVVTCLESHRRFGEALAQAEEGCKAFPGDWRLEDNLVRCYERDGRALEAFVIRRGQFDRRPGVESYRQTLQAGRAAGQDAMALRHALLETVKALEVQATDRPVQTARFGIPGVAPKSGGRDVSLRAEILCSEGRWTEASALVQSPAACQDPVLRTIAMHLPTSHADQALALLLRVFDNAMRQASSPYRGELALAGEIGQRMGAERRADWLARLRVEYKAKRNFVRDLPAG